MINRVNWIEKLFCYLFFHRIGADVLNEMRLRSEIIVMFNFVLESRIFWKYARLLELAHRHVIKICLRLRLI